MVDDGSLSREARAFCRLLACAAVAAATAAFAVTEAAESPVAATVSTATLALALEAEPAPAATARSSQDWDGLIQLVLEYLDQSPGSEPTAAPTTPTT